MSFKGLSHEKQSNSNTEFNFDDVKYAQTFEKTANSGGASKVCNKGDSHIKFNKIKKIHQKIRNQYGTLYTGCFTFQPSTENK